MLLELAALLQRPRDVPPPPRVAEDAQRAADLVRLREPAAVGRLLASFDRSHVTAQERDRLLDELGGDRSWPAHAPVVRAVPALPRCRVVEQPAEERHAAFVGVDVRAHRRELAPARLEHPRDPRLVLLPRLARSIEAA